MPVDARCGRTLADEAAARGTSARAARDAYRAALRTPGALLLPAVTRAADDGGVHKFCLAVPGRGGGAALETESVLIPMRNRRGRTWLSLCVSSQVGCRMGCTFCETARLGLLRHLDAAEIVAQYLVARDRLLAAGDAEGEVGALRTHLGEPHGPDVPFRGYRYFASGIADIVFMGMGEALDNFEAVTQAIRVLSEPNGLNFPHAQITVSTAGHLDGLRRLAALGWPNLRLAISLNAPDDALRRVLMPIARAVPLAALRRALLDYPLARKGVLTVAYVLLRGVNDGLAEARAVAAWCRDLRCVVNLIPYNPQRDAAFAAPDEATVARFAAALREAGIFVTRRRSQGQALMGACGQLGNPALRVA